MRAKILDYLTTWESRGYPQGIPEEVPDSLMREQLAPSYKAICLAILRNDVTLKSIGFEGRPSKWYGVLKRIELSARK